MDKLPLDVRSWDCPSCGTKGIDRDINGLSRYLGEKSIVSYKILDGGLRRESKFIGLSSKSMARLTHPTKYKIL